MDITGTRIKNLEILSEIGEGGMGVVFLATHAILGKKFAVKCLTPELSASSQFRERFEKEAMAQAALEHPNIVQVSDFFEHKDRYFLVMEYVDGRSLEEMIDHRGKLSEKEALPILKDILSGVNFAHSKGIIHRDIKPSNILIDNSGNAKIMDFGIALRAGDEHRLTKTGADMGTAWYVSPEQVVNPKEIDHRSDVYSIGVVLFEMLTGQTPFDGETDYTIKDKHVREAPPLISEINPHISHELSGIVMKALEKAPDDRFSGCGEFLEYVEACEHQQDRPETAGTHPMGEDQGAAETGVPHESPDPTFEDPVTGMQFVYVPGGTFIMGEAFEGENHPDVHPREVALDGFYMGRFPVTCGQWNRLMGSDPSAFAAGENHPVETVSWENAQTFIEQLIAENNRAYQFRLPTEAEWEYAARSGGKTEQYAGGEPVDTVAWYGQNSGNSTRPVRKKTPNGLGIHDMSGNVWEWCRDWFGPYASDECENPTGPSAGTQRVLRGGAWNSDRQQCQTTFRYHNWPEYKDSGWGFRVVWDTAPPEPLAVLSVTGSPGGASIWINGEDTGEKADAFIRLPAGQYNVTLAMNGYQSLTEDVAVVPGPPVEIAFALRKTPVSAPLKKKKRSGTLIKSAVVAAVCFLAVIFALVFYNKDSEKKTLQPLKTVEKTTHAKNTVTDLPPVQQTRKPARIPSSINTLKSVLFVETEPKMAHVRLLNVEQPFQQGMVLKSGRYHVEISHEGYKTRKVWINLTPGEKNTFRIKLEWTMSSLRVLCEPKDADIRVLNIKEKFHQGLVLKPGRYHVEISREGYAPERQWVTLKPGSRETLSIRLNQKAVKKPPETIPARESAPAPSHEAAGENRLKHRFIDDRGVIWDTRTGLEWIIGPDEPTTYAEAQKWLDSKATYHQGGQFRIPTTSELQTLYNKWIGTSRNMPELFKTTGWYIWARKSPGSKEILLYNFRDGRPTDYKYISASYERVFAVRAR